MTLIETIVGMAVMIVGIVGIMYGFSAMQGSAAVSTEQSRLESEMRQLSDQVRSRDAVPYVFCAVENSAQKDYTPKITLSVLPDHWTIVTLAVGSTATRGGTAVAPWQTCPAVTGRAAGADWGVQEITLRVSSSSRSLTRVVWKGAA
jgi:type II secretory pathway pseudopilin PulG